jgi:hypothetical protein
LPLDEATGPALKEACQRQTAYLLSMMGAAPAPASPGPTPEGRETAERLCVNCGRIAHVKLGEVLPECVGPDGMAACTFDLTPHEAAMYWRQQWHDQRTAHAQAIRAAQAETLREVLARIDGCGHWNLNHWIKSKLSEITGGTAEP